MNVHIISLEHPFQYLEQDDDSVLLQTQKRKLRDLLSFQISSVAAIYEESSPQKPTIAFQLAGECGLPWHNICMTDEERREAGVYEALRNRGSAPDWDDEGFSIEYRIPEDDVREDYFVEKLVGSRDVDGIVIALLGDMHTLAVAKKLAALGHVASVDRTLIAKQRWAELPEEAERGSE